MIEIAGLILYAPKDIEDTLGINGRIQARYRNKGLLPFRKMGSSIFYTQSDMRDFLENTKISSVAVKSVKKIKDIQEQDKKYSGSKENISEDKHQIKDEITESISDRQDACDDTNENEIQECSDDMKSGATDTKLQLSPIVAIKLNDSRSMSGISDIRSSNANEASSDESNIMQAYNRHASSLGSNAHNIRSG